MKPILFIGFPAKEEPKGWAEKRDKITNELGNSYYVLLYWSSELKTPKAEILHP